MKCWPLLYASDPFHPIAISQSEIAKCFVPICVSPTPSFDAILLSHPKRYHIGSPFHRNRSLALISAFSYIYVFPRFSTIHCFIAKQGFTANFPFSPFITKLIACIVLSLITSRKGEGSKPLPLHRCDMPIPYRIAHIASLSSIFKSLPFLP